MQGAQSHNLHCCGFSAQLALASAPLRPLSMCVNPHIPHAVEGTYAAPLVPGQTWTLAWADDRVVSSPVDASVVVHDGQDDEVICDVLHGQPTSLQGILRTGPLKLTLVLRDPRAYQICAVFILYCADSTPRPLLAPPNPEALLPSGLTLDSPHTPTHETLWMPRTDSPVSPTAASRRTAAASPFSSPDRAMLVGARPDDSGVAFASPPQQSVRETLTRTERELDFYRAAVHALERSMSPAAHIRFFTERLVRERTGGPDCPRADEQALTAGARICAAVDREKMLEQLRGESEVAVTQELAGVLALLLAP